MNRIYMPIRKFHPVLLSGLSQKIYCGLFLLMMVAAPVKAQDASTPQIISEIKQEDGNSGRVELLQPVQVENLLNLHIVNNKLQDGIPGYRIRIFSLSGQPARQKAEETRKNFMKSFPETDSYLEYNTPNFQIFVGNYHTKSEALYEYKKISKIFPSSFIVSDIIQIPK